MDRVNFFMLIYSHHNFQNTIFVHHDVDCSQSSRAFGDHQKFQDIYQMTCDEVAWCLDDMTRTIEIKLNELITQ